MSTGDKITCAIVGLGMGPAVLYTAYKAQTHTVIKTLAALAGIAVIWTAGTACALKSSGAIGRIGRKIG